MGGTHMAATQRPSGSETLIVEADFPSADPQTLFAYWTEPGPLQQWWPQRAEVEPYAGGSYCLSWPQQSWRLRGTYTVFEPGARLSFTWKWDHDPPETDAKVVTVAFTPLPPRGTRLHLTHGPYRETPDEQELRIEHHLAGWLYFLSRLQALLETAR